MWGQRVSLQVDEREGVLDLSAMPGSAFRERHIKVRFTPSFQEPNVYETGFRVPEVDRLCRVVERPRFGGPESEVGSAP